MGKVDKPLIINWISEYSAKVGQSLHMSCDVKGKNEVTVKWLKGYDEVDPALVHDGILVHDEIQSNDTGMYTCLVLDQNMDVLDTKRTTLTVTGVCVCVCVCVCVLACKLGVPERERKDGWRSSCGWIFVNHTLLCSL